VAERAGADFTCTVKVPVEEAGPPFAPRTTWDEGIQVARWCAEFGFDSVTPVEASVFPDTTLTRGGVPSSLWQHQGMRDRFRAAAPHRRERLAIQAGSWLGGKRAPFRPVWNRSRFSAVKAAVSIPVLAVGGIRSRAEIDTILGGGHADLVGLGRPFYAEPDLPRRLLGDAGGAVAPVACQSSNLCVPAQMLGMKGLCYNPAVVKVRSARPRG
jgi:2,4-dienoyl-CoA reductase-like NADH-dependent reductase (Old Yellow Enzyme family)